MSLAIVVRRAAVVALSTVVLAGCASDPEPIVLEPAPTAAASGGLAASERPTAFAEPAFVETEALFAAVEAAIAGQSSVHQEMSAPGQTPAAYLDQEYGDAGTDLRLYTDVAIPGVVGSFVLYRIDGRLYGGTESPTPLPTPDDDESSLASHTMRSDVLQDFRRMAPTASDLEHVGEEEILGVATRHYRMVLTLTGDGNPAIAPSAVRGPATTDLWLGADDLPVRIDIAYGETGTTFSTSLVSRVEYSSWSAPIDFDPANLDWSTGGR